jgi:integrase
MTTAGNITRRGAHSWRIKYEAGEREAATGQRQTCFLTVHGTKKDAQRELVRLLAEVENGTAVDPSRVTVAEYLREWLDLAEGLTPKTLERYRQLAEYQVIPHIGATLLQKLRPQQVHRWHAILLKTGGKDGKPLSAQTVGNAHRVLHRGLERALRLEIVNRNVAHLVPPPKVEAAEVAILTAEQIADVLIKLDGYGGRYGGLPLHPIAAVAIGTGMRRGEICALGWGAVDLDKAAVRVERSLEETAAGLRFKAPKTRYGFRTISLPANVVAILRDHRRRLIEQRLALGLGRLGDADLVFPIADSSPYPPNKLSRDWGHAVRDRKLPAAHFHALRHSHASALIAAGVDIVTVSRRLGHGSPAITLRVYAHAFSVNEDEAAARAIEAAMGSKTPV